MSLGKFQTPFKTITCVQWLPFQMKVFHSKENGLFCTHPLSIAPLFWWKEIGKQEALIWMKNSHLNRTPQYNSVRGRSEIMFAQRWGEGGYLGSILCKLLRLEVCIKRGEGGQKSWKYTNLIYVRPLRLLVCKKTDPLWIFAPRPCHHGTRRCAVGVQIIDGPCMDGSGGLRRHIFWAFFLLVCSAWRRSTTVFLCVV